MKPFALSRLRPSLHTLARLARRWSNSRIVSGGLCAGGLALLALAVHAGSQGNPSTERETFFRIATGPTSGTYFSVGKTLASVISHPPGAEPCELGGRCGVPGLIAVAQTTDGSVANARSVDSGLVESGMAQADVVYNAFWGEGVFAGKPPLDRIRVIANLYREAVHLVVRYDSDIDAVTGLRGKRVSLDLSGSGTRADALNILAAYGLGPQDVKIHEMDSSDAADMILAGELDAFFLIAGPPHPGIANLAERGAIRLVPINGAPAQRLLQENSFLSPLTLPARLYRYIGEVETLAMGASWIVHETVDDDLVYEIVRTLFNPANGPRLYAAPQKTGHIALQTTLEGVPIFLHPGAKRYYLEAGLLDE